jgi:DNA-binding transcriptional LysR family regulator
MEQALQAQDISNQLFSLAIPRVSYIAQAASEFACAFDDRKDMEIDIRETNSMHVIDAVAYGHYVLGIIRCHVEDEDYFLKNLAEKGLQHETVWQSEYMALMRQDHPLARQEVLRGADFAPYIEIAFGDEEVPYIRVSESRSGELLEHTKRILVYDRAMQLDLLRTNPAAYGWASAVPKDILERNNLIQRKCVRSRQFKDILISRAGYRFSKLDRTFLDMLFLQRNAVAYGD